LRCACHHSVYKVLSSCLLSKNFKIKIHETIILPVVLYEHGTWSLVIREELRLRLSENRVMRRRLHGKDLCNLHASPNFIREDEMEGICSVHA
jgi:hypothetical protein